MHHGELSSIHVTTYNMHLYKSKQETTDPTFITHWDTATSMYYHWCEYCDSHNGISCLFSLLESRFCCCQCTTVPDRFACWLAFSLYVDVLCGWCELLLMVVGHVGPQLVGEHVYRDKSEYSSWHCLCVYQECMWLLSDMCGMFDDLFLSLLTSDCMLWSWWLLDFHWLVHSLLLVCLWSQLIYPKFSADDIS